MATAVDRASLPQNRAQYLSGVLPARHGKHRLVPIPKLNSVFTYPIYGLMIWLSEDGQWDTLLILTDTTAPGAGPNNRDLYTARIFYTTGSTASFDYDELMDRQRSKLTIGTPAALDITSGVSPSAPPNLRDWLQFKTELIFSLDGALYRYYRDESAGTETLYSVGIATPGAPTLAATSVGSMTSSATYSYKITAEDERGREGSPSPAASVTLSSTQNSVTVTRGTLSVGGATGIANWNIYRLNPGGEEYLFVATVAVGTTTYSDTASDSSILANDAAPDAGENDVPNIASIMAQWKDRLVLNDLTNPSNIQISNAGSPTQFSSLPLPTNVDDGIRAYVGGAGDNEVTGLGNLGSMLAVFKRSSIHLLQGDSIENYQLLPIHERGCAHPKSIQRCENFLIFRSHDGVYGLMYENGYIIKKMSTEIDNLFRGFITTRQEGEATAYGSPESIEVEGAKVEQTHAFYYQNTYYLSEVSRTLAYDMIGGGWCDTGWGAVPFAAVYRSQMAGLRGGAPETVFLARGERKRTILPTSLVEVTYYDTKTLEYFTAADTPYDPDATRPDGTKIFARIVTRPFDGDGPPQHRRKRAKRFTRYGDTKVKTGQRLGTLKAFVDGELRAAYPIFAYSRIAKGGSLYEQEFSSLVTGEEIWFEELYTNPDIELGNHILEYVFEN